MQVNNSIDGLEVRYGERMQIREQAAFSGANSTLEALKALDRC